MANDKIDVVYLWVDGADKKWRAARDEWYEKTFNKKHETTNNSLYRDNGELKYSLRSIEKFIPWANHIYIITGFNQKPKWLNTDNPKITIISHEQIMPKNALPTFNSNSIEMCIPNIPNLSEKFILMNDDTFFNKSVGPDFFFDKRGRAIVLYNNHHKYYHDTKKWMQNTDAYTCTIILSALKIKEIFGKDFFKQRPSHGIDPYIKSSWQECKSHPLIHDFIEKQIRHKFRTNAELQRWVINLYDNATGRAVFKKARCYKSGRHKISNAIYNALHWGKVTKSPVFCFDAKQSQESIQHAPIFCINDSQFTTEDIIQSNINFLHEKFPNKSQFEK